MQNVTTLPISNGNEVYPVEGDTPELPVTLVNDLDHVVAADHQSGIFVWELNFVMRVNLQGCIRIGVILNALVVETL